MHWLSDPLVKISANTLNPKPEELGSWNVERIFILYYVSCVMCHFSCVMCHVSCVMCHVSYVACRVSSVTCHLSLTQTATATDPPPANSPFVQSRLVHKDPQIQKNIEKKKNIWNEKILKRSRGMPILAVRSLSRSLQFTKKRVFRDGTYKQKDRRLTYNAT